jgi:hypothetical protein
VILENGHVLINDILGLIAINLILKSLVVLDDIKELVREIVLRTLIVILNHRGADLRRGNREHGTDHPVGTTPVTIETHEIHVLVSDTTEEAENILHLQRLTLLPRLRELRKARSLNVVPLSNDLRDPFTDKLRRLASTTPVLRFLSTPADILALAQNLTPSCLTATLQNVSVKMLVDKKFRTANTNALKNIQNVFKELDIIHRSCETVVPKMAGAVVICLATGAAGFSIV